MGRRELSIKAELRPQQRLVIAPPPTTESQGAATLKRDIVRKMRLVLFFLYPHPQITFPTDRLSQRYIQGALAFLRLICRVARLGPK